MKEKLVYLDTNLIIGYGKRLAREYKDNKRLLSQIFKRKRKTKIKTDNILDKLKLFGYSFITSYLTNFEFIYGLSKEESLPIKNMFWYLKSNYWLV